MESGRNFRQQGSCGEKQIVEKQQRNYHFCVFEELQYKSGSNVIIRLERRAGASSQKDLERGPNYLTHDINSELSSNTAPSVARKLQHGGISP